MFLSFTEYNSVDPINIDNFKASSSIYPEICNGFFLSLLKITNNDGGAAASYDYNLNGVFSNLAASSFDVIDGTIVNYMTVITGAGGSTLIEAQILPIPKDEPEVEVQV